MNFHGYLALVNKRNRIDCYSKPKWNRKLKRCCRIAYTDFKEQRKELTTNQCSVQNCHAKNHLVMATENVLNVFPYSWAYKFLITIWTCFWYLIWSCHFYSRLALNRSWTIMVNDENYHVKLYCLELQALKSLTDVILASDNFFMTHLSWRL